MRDGKRNILGVLVDAVDYETSVDRIVSAADRGDGYSVTALAVHGLVTGARDREQRYRLNSFDLVTPDGQPVRWAINLMYRTRLPDRVYGPTLMLRVCEAAADAGLPIFLYGSSLETLEPLRDNLERRFPALRIAGAEPSRFRPLSPEEKAQLTERIKSSGARITFVGLGCPRQEVFAYEYRDDLAMPVIAVGAAFDYHAGRLIEPPAWIQRAGLQWAYRLHQEPRRLWRRYVTTNSTFLALFLLQLGRLYRPDPQAADAPQRDLSYG